VLRLRLARLVTHYWGHAGWLKDGILLQEATKLAGIPGVLVHGRLDISSPADTAWNLAQAWPDAELHLVEDATHGAGGRGMSELVIAALDRFGSN
jgi:proline iminopeptidase